MRPRLRNPEAIEREERAKRRQQKEEKAAAVQAFGDASLTVDAYWARPESASTYGVVEVNTSMGSGAFYVTSVFWGLKERESAELLAAFCNTVYAAYDARRYQVKQFAVFGPPPCTVTVVVQGGRAMHLALPSEFPVRHQPQRWVEITVLAQDYYLNDLDEDKAVRQACVMSHMTQTFFVIANRSLPVGFFDAASAGCFVKPEGFEPRALTDGDTHDTKVCEKDRADAANLELRVGEDEDEDEEEDEDEDDDDDPMEFAD